MLSTIAIFSFFGIIFGGLWIEALERGEQRTSGRYARLMVLFYALSFLVITIGHVLGQ